MKRRVRGLLHRKWHQPLLALVLAALPLAAAGVLAYFLLRPLSEGVLSMGSQITGLFDNGQDAAAALLSLMYSFEIDVSPLVAALPGISLFLFVYLFACMPIAVSLSGYFLSFLRGKHPSPLEGYACFSGRYPRALGGMLYMALFVVLWALTAFVAPFGLYVGGLALIELFAEQLSLYQFYVMGGLIILCIVWFVVFTLVFINRLLAYVLTPVCIAAQPRLPAYRAVRLSRKLMRGSKWRLIGLFLSFLLYELPALIAGVLLLTMPLYAPLLGLTEILKQSIRLFMGLIIAANQLVFAYVWPYMAACFRAFYIERKREALMDEEVTPDDFASKPRKAVHAHE